MRIVRPEPLVAALFACLTLASAVGCAARGEPARATPGVAVPEKSDPVIHVVGPGQTLWRIATVYGIELDDLVAANGIEDPARIDVGQALIVPGATRVLEIPASPVVTGRLVWPVAGGMLVSGFGTPRRGHRHKGIDIAAGKGATVRAAAPGRVTYAGSGMTGYGKTVIVDHGAGLSSLYAHNSHLLVRRGQRVESGQAIARVGRSGNATSTHCHFEVRERDVAVDPLRYLGGATP